MLAFRWVLAIGLSVVGLVSVPGLWASEAERDQVEEADDRWNFLGREGEDLAAQWDFVLRGMVSERERLVSGEYRIRGERGMIEDGELQVARPFWWYCAFDLVEGKMRFDERRREPFKVIGPSELLSLERGLLSPDEAEEAEIQNHSINLPGKSISWVRSEDSGTAVAAVEETPKMAFPIAIEHEKTSGLALADVRAVGLILAGDLTNVTLQDFVEAYSGPEIQVDELAIEATGILRAALIRSWEHFETRHVFWINLRHGFTPERGEVYMRHGQQWREDPFQWMDTCWQEVSGVWFPIRAVLSGETTRGSALRYEMDFTWESVNEPPSPERFTYADFDPPAGTRVVDRRLGREILVEIIGEPSPHEYAMRGRWRVWVLVLVAATCLMMVAVGVRLWFYHKRAGLIE